MDGGPVVTDGMKAWSSSAVWLRTLPGLPTAKTLRAEDARAAVRDRRAEAHLEGPQHQAISATQNATNVSIMLLTDQRFCITPPYRTARPGTLISPTKVAAVSCQALSPALSQRGYDSQVMCLHSLSLWIG